MNRIYLLFFLAISCFFITSISACESIIGGHKAAANQFPFQVSLQTHGTLNLCGGGIIGDQFILTAAHCVVLKDGKFYDQPMFVFAGTNELYRASKSTVLVQVKKIFVPKKYKPNSNNSIITGDIAVLMLNHSLGIFSHRHKNYLRVLRLPKSRRETYANKTAIIAGFGWDWIVVKDNYEHGDLSDGHLRFAKVDVFNNSECNKDFPQLRIVENEICGRVKHHELFKPNGTCNGDSGGPLVYDGIVIGVLSISPHGCEEQTGVAIYTRVSHYLTFIHTVMKGKLNKKILTHP